MPSPLGSPEESQGRVILQGQEVGSLCFPHIASLPLTPAPSFTHTHRYTHTQIHTHTDTHTDICTCTRIMDTHTHTRHAHTCAHMACTHMCTHGMHTHVHTQHTCTHIPFLILFLPFPFSPSCCLISFLLASFLTSQKVHVFTVSSLKVSSVHSLSHV